MQDTERAWSSATCNRVECTKTPGFCAPLVGMFVGIFCRVYEWKLSPLQHHDVSPLKWLSSQVIITPIFWTFSDLLLQLIRLFPIHWWLNLSRKMSLGCQENAMDFFKKALVSFFHNMALNYDLFLYSMQV